MKNKGFTIIEMMVAVSIFLVIIISGLGTLLNANLLDQKSKDMRSILDNLSFTLDEMSRNIRVGTTYRCMNTWVQGVDPQSTPLDDPQSCGDNTLGKVFVFEETHGNSTPDFNSDQWVYKIESPGGNADYNIYKSTDGGANWVQLNADEVHLTSMSNFAVLGAEGPLAPLFDTQQPLVTLRLVGNVVYKDTTTPFSLQTAISQRSEDR